MPNQNESQLLHRACNGDRDAVAALYRAHVQAIYRYINYRVPDSTLADDLTAEVFLRMVEGLPHYRMNGVPFEAWLYRIAAARVADYYRRRSRRPQEALTDQEPDRGESPEGKIQYAEEKDELRAALRNLTADQQDVLLLRFVERKSHAEVAAIMEKSISAVKSTQHRALTRLAELMGIENKGRHYLRGDNA
ncbi:MAG: sigma-70 family RNA polymerase sigma factor [Anaerolineae bacterium]|nr:sigma-70 family RNA polymerase sigma factor [Anaerolineae bacterium]